MGIGKGRGRTFKRYRKLHNFNRRNPVEWSLKPTEHLELKNPALLNQELVMAVSFLKSSFFPHLHQKHTFHISLYLLYLQMSQGCYKGWW